MNIAYLPAKEHSERFPGKNWKPLWQGVSLVQHAINTISQCDSIDEIILDTDHPDPPVDAMGKPLRCWRRPEHLRGHEVEIEQLIPFFLLPRAASTDKDRISNICLVQATNPWTTPLNIDAGYLLLQGARKTPRYQSVVSTASLAKYSWASTDGELPWPDNYPMGTPPLRHRHEKETTVENGAFYWATRAQWMRQNRVSYQKTMVYEMAWYTMLEIDTPTDLAVALAVRGVVHA